MRPMTFKHSLVMAAAIAAAALAGAASPAQAAPPVGNPVAGKAAFAACANCHQVGPSARSGFGPQLNGIVGRPAGALAGYAYSASMKNAKIIWTEPALAAFIQAPNEVVPGTKMRFWSLGYNEQKIADLLAYLRSFEAARS